MDAVTVSIEMYLMMLLYCMCVPFLKVLCVPYHPVCVSGSGGVPSGWEEGAGEHETGPGEADQNAGVRPETREVRQMAANSFFLSLSVIHSQLSVIWSLKDSLYLLVVLPSCGILWGCRAKHQKLKTGNDQSPGDKKPETEADQRKWLHYLLLWLYFQKTLKVLLIAVASLLTNPFCSSQWAGWVRLWASQSDVLEGGTSATTQVRPRCHQLLLISVIY